MNNQNNERPVAIKVSGVKKMYKLGQIGGGTLREDIQSWWARKRGKEDPNAKIGTDQRSYGKAFMALNGIDLTIYQGEAVGIIGANGAGKSTLLKLLSRVTAPTEGEIDIYGRVTSMLEVGTGFNGEMTGRENIYMNGAILGMTKAEIDAKIEDIIDFSEVREFIDTPVKRYSSGMYVKLAFSVASHLDSEIVIMDEVLAVGDMAFQTKCLTKMREAAKQEGRTVLYVSHNMNTIRQLCDRCIVLDQGKVIFEGDVEKAIRVYMGFSDSTDFPVLFDFRNKKRDHHFGKEVFVNEARILNKSAARFYPSEKIEFEIILASKINMPGLQLIMRVKDKDNVEKVAASLSEEFSVTAFKEKRMVFSLETTGLVDNQYCLSFEIIKENGAGDYHSFDNPYARIQILIENRKTDIVFWSKRYWGNVKLPPIKVLKEEEPAI